MIEVLALAGAVGKIASSISSAVKAGKDVHSLMPAFGKLAKLESEINLAESGRHKGPLGRLTSSEEEGFAIAQAKMKHKESMNELRSMCRLYGTPGMWDMVVAEQAAARKRHKAALEEEAERRDKIFWVISVVAGVAVFAIGTGGLFWFAAIFSSAHR
tara:strand:- start:393 stop:866 length:474 start_codon:yes stop_codon:yes gene_type:complete